jgi:hypothetical protein
LELTGRRFGACQALQRPGEIDAVEAEDGADAWRKLSSSAFDVVITDINMPVMDGLKLVGFCAAGVCTSGCRRRRHDQSADADRSAMTWARARIREARPGEGWWTPPARLRL